MGNVHVTVPSLDARWLTQEALGLADSVRATVTSAAPAPRLGPTGPGRRDAFHSRSEAATTFALGPVSDGTRARSELTMALIRTPSLTSLRSGCPRMSISSSAGSPQWWSAMGSQSLLHTGDPEDPFSVSAK